MIATKPQIRTTDTDNMNVFAEWVAKAAHITPPGCQYPQQISVSAGLQPVGAGSATITMEFCASFFAYSANYQEALRISWRYRFEEYYTEGKEPGYVKSQMKSLAERVKEKCSLLEVLCKKNTLNVSFPRK